MQDIIKVLEFAANNGKNVLMRGRHGVGKTEMVKKLFTQKYGPHGEGWLYFSVPTMDPWVDFVGCPKEAEDENGKKYLDIVRRKEFVGDKIQAIFLDEFNRPSSPKIIDAVMELLQFKSINGHKLSNLQLVWAAINPENDEDYKVDVLDAAAKSRFHLRIDVPYEPSVEYFQKKFGDMGNKAIGWWKGLNKEAKKEVCPRTLEYALEIFTLNGPVQHVLGEKIPATEFIMAIGSQLSVESLLEMQPEEITKTLSVGNNYNKLRLALMKPEVFKKIGPYIPPERLAQMVSVDCQEIKDLISAITVDIPQVSECTKGDKIYQYMEHMRPVFSTWNTVKHHIEVYKHYIQMGLLHFQWQTEMGYPEVDAELNDFES